MYRALKRELGAMLIILGQLNDNIEDVGRIHNAAYHYPKKGDIYGSKAIYQACDGVVIAHAPETLGIPAYGAMAFETRDLLAYHQIKQRNGKVGLVRLKKQFDKGDLIQWPSHS